MVSKKFMLLGLGLLCTVAQASEEIKGGKSLLTRNLPEGVHAMSLYQPCICNTPITVGSDTKNSALWINHPENLSGKTSIHVFSGSQLYIGDEPYPDTSISEGVYRLVREDGTPNNAEDIRIVIRNNAQAYTSAPWGFEVCAEEAPALPESMIE